MPAPGQTPRERSLVPIITSHHVMSQWGQRSCHLADHGWKQSSQRESGHEAHAVQPGLLQGHLVAGVL